MKTPLLDIRNCDCMDLMGQYPDKHFDIAVVDPPYGIGADKFSNGQNLNRDDGWRREESTANRTRKNRLTQGGGKLKDRLLNNSDCSWDIPPPPEYFTELFRVSKNQIIWGGNYFNLPPTRCMVCWDKVQPWENFSQFELAWTSLISLLQCLDTQTQVARGQKQRSIRPRSPRECMNGSSGNTPRRV